jgi:hypothetical protein
VVATETFEDYARDKYYILNRLWQYGPDPFEAPETICTGVEL